VTAVKRQFAEKSARLHDRDEARATEHHVAECVEWQVGLVEVNAFTISINGQLLSLGNDGWAMHAFIGSTEQLLQRLIYGAHVSDSIHHVASPAHALGFVAKVLKDSGSAAALAKSAHVLHSVDEWVEKGSHAAAAVAASAKQLQSDASRIAQELALQVKATQNKAMEMLNHGAKHLDHALPTLTRDDAAGKESQSGVELTRPGDRVT